MNNKLSKFDLIKSWSIWMNFSHACYNYERLQGLAYSHCMIPIFNKLYDKDEEKLENIKNHMEFFNTEPNIGTPIHGHIIALEEKKSNGEEVQNISTIKKALMGSMAGLGDSITQTIYTPIMIVLAMISALYLSVIGVIACAAILSGIIIYYSYTGWMKGYYIGQSAIIERINSIKNNKLFKIFPILFCMLFAMVFLKAIEVDINLSKEIINTSILKYVVLIISCIYYLLLKKGVNSKYLVYSIYIVPLIFFIIIH